MLGLPFPSPLLELFLPASAIFVFFLFLVERLARGKNFSLYLRSHLQHGRQKAPSGFSISKRRFADFYFFGLATAFLLREDSLVFLLLALHLLRRLFECLFLTRRSPGSTMTVFQYAFGLFYYQLLLAHCRVTIAPARVLLFVLCSVVQSLAHLQLYLGDPNSLPETFLFAIPFPHFVAEVGIFAALAVNRFFIGNLLWACTNLSVTAYYRLLN